VAFILNISKCTVWSCENCFSPRLVVLSFVSLLCYFVDAFVGEQSRTAQAAKTFIMDLDFTVIGPINLTVILTLRKLFAFFCIFVFFTSEYHRIKTYSNCRFFLKKAKIKFNTCYSASYRRPETLYSLGSGR